MKIIELQQGSEAWHQHRATARNASDASAMMACSPYKTRAQLLQERVTGIRPDVDAATQARFARGHEIEAKARVLIEEMLGQDLYPVIGTTDDGYLSASFDGITMDETTVVEIKSWNEGKAAEVREGRIPTADVWQCVHQLAVSDANVLIYVVSDGTPERTVMTRAYPSDRDRLALLNGWEQFDKDVAAWVPTESVPAAQAAPMESLPAVVVQVSGALTVGGNLDAFGDALRAFIERIPQRPTTDQQFADADAACKALKKAEDALAQAEDGALAQISDVELMRRTVADLKDLARRTRLATEKLVTAEKEARKLAIVNDAQTALLDHVAKLNADLRAKEAGHLVLPSPGVFAPCVKGLKSLDSMTEKVTAELIRLKAEATETALRMHQNRDILRSDGHDWSFLFPDFAAVGAKSTEDFAALAHMRISQHKQAEAERMEKERQRIEAEAKAKAEREAQAAAEAERARIRAEEQAKAQAEAAVRVAEQAAARQAAEGPTADAVRKLADDMDAPITHQLIPSDSRELKTGERITLGHINALLAPISISAAGLAELGFNPVATLKAAKLYDEDDIPAMCRAIAEHVTSVAQVEAAS